jgi:hypothetical protein
MTTTNEPEVIAELRGWHREGCESLFTIGEVLAVDIPAILAAYDAIVVERDEWRDAAKWAEGQHQHWKTVAEAATAQRDAAVRERDALRHELKIAQTTVLVERDYIEQVRAERDAAVREREDVSAQLWDCMNERDGYKAKLAASSNQRSLASRAHMRLREQVTATLAAFEDDAEPQRFIAEYKRLCELAQFESRAAVAAETQATPHAGGTDA